MQTTSTRPVNRLPTYEQSMVLAQQAPSCFIAEARALAAKHATSRTTEQVKRFSDDEKCIHQMTRYSRASRSW